MMQFQNQKPSNRLGYIDGMRGIFALTVAIMHLNKFLIFPGAYLAVDFFFILSGFILCYVYIPRISKLTFSSFFKARLARLWPLHIFTILLYVAIYIPSNYFVSGKFRWTPSWNAGNNFSSLFEHIFLIQNIGLQNTLTWNYPSWSISVEIWVNVALFFIIASLALKKTNTKLLAILTLIVFSCYVVLETTLPHIGGKRAIITQYAYIFNAGLLRGFAGIFLGVLVYKTTAAIDKNMERTFPAFGAWFKGALELALLGAIFYIICFQEKSETDITALFMFALLLTIMTIGKKSLLRSILAIKPLTFLGMISYSIYLCHAPLLQFFKRWPKLVGEGWNEWVIAGIFTMTTIILATILYYLVEKPGQKAFKKVWEYLVDQKTVSPNKP